MSSSLVLASEMMVVEAVMFPVMMIYRTWHVTTNDKWVHW